MYKYFEIGLPRKCTWLKIRDDTFECMALLAISLVKM